jgi:DNA-binding MarR family transcriptional regulator
MAKKSADLEAKLREISSVCACYKVRKAARSITQYYDEALKPCNIKITQFSLLIVLTLAGPVPIGRLAELLVMDRTTLTRNVDLLVRDGLAEVIPGKDKRTRLVRTTAEGRAVLTSAIPLWQDAQDSILDRLGRQNWKDLAQKLAAVTALSQLS